MICLTSLKLPEPDKSLSAVELKEESVTELFVLLAKVVDNLFSLFEIRRSSHYSEYTIEELEAYFKGK